MRTAIASLLLATFAPLAAWAASATATVAVAPCALTYATYLPANTPLGIEVRGYCGVPTNATAVFLHLKAGGSATAGKAYVWPYNESLPAYSQFNYEAATGNPISTSGVLVRLSGSYGEDNLWAQSTTAIFFSAVVEGYIAPASP